MELQEPQSGGSGLRDILNFRLLLSMAGISFAMLLFLIIMTVKGKFSLAWFVVTIVCIGATTMTVMDWRDKKSWLVAIGASLLLGVILGALSAVFV
jgi:hypothetical protein